MLSLNMLFYAVSALVLLSALMVIVMRNPVYCVLFLVLTFVASSFLWMILQAEFLALALIFVYVGAVMTLFLFVVMMINVDLAVVNQGFVRYLPLGILMTALLAGLLLSVVQASHLPAAFTVLPMQPENYSNVQSLGEVLYTQYAYPFELAAVVLLVAIIATISLTFRGKRGDRKSQKIAAQIAVKPSERLEIIKMPTEKK